ncbi:hypothetical protein Q0590_01670 [Rhodocytophaga aerolata]|uniref:YD repeat-containing protein n=1 Tax=Rhodocytophaga aerolata TaxID=455078 RepID=A0ABT8QYL9_9BACT|nr:hypothetical protein [Rhodocytophaga aerolata]MDO1444936.1 hypothetical protein [Rhodocytophaga aerolata]
MKNSTPFYLKLFKAACWVVLPGLLFSCTRDTTPQPADAPSRIKKITWRATDFQQYTYLPDGKIASYISQWLYMNNDVQEIKRTTANFTYDAAGYLDKIVFDSGFFNKYYYEGTVLKKMEEYDNSNRLRLTHTYIYNSNGRLTESLSQVHDLFEGEANQFKHVYAYDARGNLTEQKLFNKLPNQTTFTLSSITRYEGYDDKKSVDNLAIVFPYLPGITFYVNNPGKQTTLAADGTTISFVNSSTYSYNEKGYPAQKTVRIETSPQVEPQTASYEYE